MGTSVMSVGKVNRWGAGAESGACGCPLTWTHEQSRGGPAGVGRSVMSAGKARGK